MFKDIDSFRAEKRALRVERDQYADALASRWESLQDPVQRGILLRDAVGDVLHSWKPYKRVHDLLHGRISGDMVASIGMTVAGFQRSWTKRLLYSGLSMLLGKVMGRNGIEEGESTLSALAKGVGAIVSKFRQREHRHTEEEAVPEERL